MGRLPGIAMSSAAWTCVAAAAGKPVRGSVDRGTRNVLPHEEGIDGRKKGVEIPQRCLQVLGPVVVQDHGPLAGNRYVVSRMDLRGGRRGQQGRKQLPPICAHSMSVPRSYGGHYPAFTASVI